MGDFHLDSAISRYEFDMERAVAELRSLGFTRDDFTQLIDDVLEARGEESD